MYFILWMSGDWCLSKMRLINRETATHKKKKMKVNLSTDEDTEIQTFQTVTDHVWVWLFPRQNLEQCWRAELWPATGETEGPPAQGQGGGMFLWGHDRPQHPHGHETPGTGRRVPTHWQVSGAIKLISFVLLDLGYTGFLQRTLVSACVSCNLCTEIMW